MLGAAPSPHLPHHDGSSLYVSDDCPQPGDEVEVRLRVPHASAADEVRVRTVVDGEPRYVAAEATAVDDTETWYTARLPVRHLRTPYRFLLLGGRSGYRWVNGAGVFGHDVPDREDFSVVSHPAPPAWLADSVVYQVFPDRFARSPASSAVERPEWALPAGWDDPIAPNWRDAVRQVYGGDLRGLAARLDHVERLGVNLVYLTPFFPSRSSHRYDASTFDHVDPLLGGDQALAELTAEAHRRGIRVIGDLTTNHSGHEHAWFSSAQADAGSDEASFYLFRRHPDDYVAWFDVPSLPKLDHSSQLLRERMIAGDSSVVRRWLEPPFELDGWRIDVANMTGRLGLVDLNHDVARALRAAMAKVRPDLWLVAEHCHDATTDLAGDGWHGTMAYTWFTRPVWSWLRGPRDVGQLGFPGGTPKLGGAEVVDSMRWLSAGVPWRSVASSMTLLDSHDTARFSSVVADPATHVVGLAWLLTHPGVPMVFAGDEVGVQGTDENRARLPFPWDEQWWDRGLLDAHRTLIALRRTSHALRHGGLRYVHAGPDSVTFLRESADERVLVHLARAPHEPVALDLRALGLRSARQLTRLFGDIDIDIDGGRLALPGNGPTANIWRIDPDGS